MTDVVTTFEIGGQTYNVVKKGVAQARQVSALGSWLAQYGVEAYRAVQDTSDGASGLEVLGAILEHLDENSLLQLFDILFGCGMDVCRDEFDVALLIDGAVAIYENSPAMKRLMSRFFSVSSSSSTPTEQSTQ
jgi:hypothetical protein